MNLRFGSPTVVSDLSLDGLFIVLNWILMTFELGFEIRKKFFQCRHGRRKREVLGNLFSLGKSLFNNDWTMTLKAFYTHYSRIFETQLLVWIDFFESGLYH